MSTPTSTKMEQGLETQECHPLLDELRGVLRRLKCTPQPIRDGHTHLVPFCESLEAVFRSGLKNPNSWFGLNKQDYWAWIEPLQDYYFNEKQNPILRDVVTAVATSSKLRTLQAKGRCFLRIALCQKLLSVPIDHLAKNKRLTNYWYHSGSIISNPALREVLMGLLFEVTELDFELDVDSSSFLDETWVIPVFLTKKLAPIKTLDMKVGYADCRAVIVSVEEGSLADKAGVEVGDALDELCGEPVYDSTHGKLKQILMTKTVDATELTVVKKHLPDGSPFYPILRRELQLQNQPPPASPENPLLSHRRPSRVVQTHGESTDYSIVYLGKVEGISKEPTEDVIDAAVSWVLNSTESSQEIVVRVNKSEVSLCPPQKEPLLQLPYSALGGCGRGVMHQTCMALMVVGGASSEEKQFSAYVCETPSSELAQAICTHIARGFNHTVRLKDGNS